MSRYFPPYKSSGGNIKVELGLSSYKNKADLKNVTHADVSNFALKTNLANLKTEKDQLEIAKLMPVADVLAKLSNGLNNDNVQKTMYKKLLTKVNNIDTKGFVLKTKYDTGKSDLKKEISNVKKRFLIQVHLLKNRL